MYLFINQFPTYYYRSVLLQLETSHPDINLMVVYMYCSDGTTNDAQSYKLLLYYHAVSYKV